MNNLIEKTTEQHEAVMSRINAINKKLDETFVTKTEFEPVRKIVYGIVGVVLTAVAYAVFELTKK